MDYTFARTEKQLMLLDKIVSNAFSKLVISDCLSLLETVEKDIKVSSRFIPEKEDIQRVENLAMRIKEKTVQYQNMNYATWYEHQLKFR